MSGARWFAFLRAINTGDRRLTNERLLAPFTALGFADVAAYQAAGNVTFRTDTDVDGTEIERALAGAYGFDVPLFLRSEREIKTIAATEPFTAKELAGTAGKVQVSFLRAAPTEAQRGEVRSLAPGEDRVCVIGREWYWLPVDGVGASALPVGRVERVLGELTMRTHGTVQRMASRFLQPP